MGSFCSSRLHVIVITDPHSQTAASLIAGESLEHHRHGPSYVETTEHHFPGGGLSHIAHISFGT